MLEVVKKLCVYAYVAILKAEHGLNGFRDYTDFWEIKRAVTQGVTALLKKSVKSNNPFNPLFCIL